MQFVFLTDLTLKYLYTVRQSGTGLARDRIYRTKQDTGSCVCDILSYSSFPSGHEVRPIKDLFRRHDCVLLVVCLMVVQVFFR
jgi:hypothetical protein